MAIVKHEPAPREVEMNPATMIQAIVDKGITAESVGVMKDLIAMQREMKAEAGWGSLAWSSSALPLPRPSAFNSPSALASSWRSR